MECCRVLRIWVLRAVGALCPGAWCAFAVMLLASASAAHGQVIEEGGFPVKGGSISGESFSLSCPPRLVVETGESVLFSCSAAVVPEEGIRYEWESLSGGSLHLLSSANERSPLFTAPVSGESAEYVYRLTAMSVGVYETATVTVTVGGFVEEGQEAFEAPGEECSSFGGFGRGQEGCLPWEKAPSPDSFGDSPEDEGIVPWPSFPESPGAEGKDFPVSSRGDSAFQTPPYLDCPSAVFLQELETGQVECYVSDASGEEHLEYMWEPVGSTTRDYLDNPRLIPEDSPYPLVVAPEAPRYETLESFRSGETTFRYRYRLTATSRATGLSSWQEVEVFVSSSRPSVYCPLEVVVEEGATIGLDCEGVDPLSHRMDYDEDGASIEWEWEGLWGTSTEPLAATDLSSALFTAPPGSAGKAYHYIASMTSSASGAPRTTRRRVSVTVAGAEEKAVIGAVAELGMTAPARGGSASDLQLICNGGTDRPLADLYFYGVVETEPDFVLDCEATGGPSGVDPVYAWSAVSPQSLALLSDPNIRNPTFTVIDVGRYWQTQYTLRVEASDGTITVTAEFIVIVAVVDRGRVFYSYVDKITIDEGAPDFTMDIVAVGDTTGLDRTYSWSGSEEALNLLSATDILTPQFYVPEDVNGKQSYVYTVDVYTGDADTERFNITVEVRDTYVAAPSVTCNNSYVFEWSDDIMLDCSVTDEPSGATYSWEARGGTTDTDLLISGTDGPTPTFAVPDEVDETTRYEYLLTVSAANAEDGTAEVTVTVLNRSALALVCTSSYEVYEGSEDFAFDCTASGAPAGVEYTYMWEAWDGTTDTDLLISGTDGPSPVFSVPDEVAGDETYEYLLTVSATNAEDAAAEVTVTVLNKGDLSVVCTDPDAVYEGAEDFALDCAASGAPAGSVYAYAWTARGSTSDTSLLGSVDIASPVFFVPDEVAEDETYEYLLTVSATNAEDATAEVEVTMLNKGDLSVVCTDPDAVYEGAEDFALDCAASGAPAGSVYAYAWTARGSTSDTALLGSVYIASPVFSVPDEVAGDETYEYLLTVSATNAEDAAAEVTVTVLNKGDLSVVCTDPDAVYEGAEDFALDCAASGAPAGSVYAYAWTARGSTSDTSLLGSVDIASPVFFVPDEVAEDETYEYLLTVSATNAEDATAEVEVTMLNKGDLSVVCTDPDAVYEGAEDFALDCAASGAPAGSVYAYAWTARGSTSDTALLGSVYIASPVFSVPDEVAGDETYEYLLTVSATNAEDAAAEVTVTVLNKGDLSVVCTDPDAVYEGAEDFALDCAASGAPAGSVYAYAWTARGSTSDTSLLGSVDIASPVFFVPDEVAEDETYEYLLTVSATNAEDATAEVEVTVLDRASVAEPVSPPVAESSPEAAEPSLPQASSLGVTVSASSLRFGVQSADTQVSLDPMTDGISTRVLGPYHAGRMTLSLDGSEALDENGEMDLSIELASPVVLRREGGIEAASIVLAPNWSFAESCEQLSSQAIGGLYTEVTLSEDACRLLRFGGELDLTGVPSGRYAGSMDIILRSGESEETHSVEVDVTVIPAQQVITIGPRGVRFSTSRELPAGLTEEQNLSIYPDVAFLTEEKPHGVFELSNPSLIPLEVTVSARFGYTEAAEAGREVVVEDTSRSHLGDLSQVVDIHPGVLVLMPGEEGLVRYGVKGGALATMAEKGYAAFFDVVSEPRQYVRSDQMPEEVTGEKTARVTMRVPGVYVPGEGASQLRATLSSISYVGSLSATFLLETQDHPFVGEVVAYDGDGRELGRRETLVYTRSRVRIPLDRMPEEGTVFLRFAPRGSGRVPEPASIEWDAPRRDIGEAGNKDGATTPATLVQKP